jgi:hypothetical protein
VKYAAALAVQLVIVWLLFLMVAQPHEDCRSHRDAAYKMAETCSWHVGED